MTTSIRSKSIIAIFVAAAIVPVASAGAAPVEPVLAGEYSASRPVKETGSATLTQLGHPGAAQVEPATTDLGQGPSSGPSYSSLTALSHDSSSAPSFSSLTALSHDSSPAPSSTPSTSSLTALSHDSIGPVAIRRDGSQAEPFVANVGSQPTTAGDGFDWGDAAIGAGAGLLAACVAMLGSAAIGGRRSSRPTTAASQGA